MSPARRRCALPQMGWNTLDFAPGAHPLLDGLRRATTPISSIPTPCAAAPRRGPGHHRLRRAGRRHRRPPATSPAPNSMSRRASRSACASWRTSSAGRHERGRPTSTPSPQPPELSVERVTELDRPRHGAALRGDRRRDHRGRRLRLGRVRRAGWRWSATSAASCWCRNASSSSPGSTASSSAAPSWSARRATTRRRPSRPP